MRRRDQGPEGTPEIGDRVGGSAASLPVRFWLYGLIALFAVIAPQRLVAHSGGAPVLIDAPAGPYRVFAWIQPEPSRVGRVHLDVALTLAPPPDAPPNQLVQPVMDAIVRVTWMPQRRGQALVTQASPQAGLAGFYYEIETELGVADQWHVAVEVQGPAGHGAASFERQVLAARRVNWLLVASALAALLALIGLMGLWNRRQMHMIARENVVQ
jgi:hypothetical protein